jgi:hypothetical protein
MPNAPFLLEFWKLVPYFPCSLLQLASPTFQSTTKAPPSPHFQFTLKKFIPTFQYTHTPLLVISSSNQCLSPLKLWVWIPLMAGCTWCNIMLSNMSVTCLCFSRVLQSPPTINWLPRYSWNVVNPIPNHRRKWSVYDLEC